MRSKDRFAAAAGAIGFVEVPRNDGSAGRGDPVRRGGRPLIDWVDARGRAGSVPPGLQLQLAFRNDWAARLFEGAPKSLGCGPVGSQGQSQGPARAASRCGRR